MFHPQAPSRPRISARRGRRLVPLVLLIGLLPLGSLGARPGPVEARCSCIGIEELPEATLSADAVFLGTVRDASGVRQVPLAGASDGAEVMLSQRLIEFRVLSGWKGIEEATIQVRTGLTDGDCGFPFEEGATYLVFARSEGMEMTTSLCSRTAEVGDALSDLVELGQPSFSPDLG